MKLNDMYEQMKSIDLEIVRLMEKRFNVIDSVVQYKKENGLQVRDESGECEELEMIAANVSEKSRRYVVELFRVMIEQSKLYQENGGALPNIILIGMPGCGKTSIGRCVARKMKKAFIDIDELIARRTGRSPAEIIKQDGEAAFREIETEVLRLATSESNAVIATGGGVVVCDHNRELMSANSIIFYIKRPIELLTTRDRPLSQEKSVKQLLREREVNYIGWSNRVVDNVGIDLTADNIVNIINVMRIKFK